MKQFQNPEFAFPAWRSRDGLCHCVITLKDPGTSLRKHVSWGELVIEILPSTCCRLCGSTIRDAKVPLPFCRLLCIMNSTSTTSGRTPGLKSKSPTHLRGVVLTRYVSVWPSSSPPLSLGLWLRIPRQTFRAGNGGQPGIETLDLAPGPHSAASNLALFLSCFTLSLHL